MTGALQKDNIAHPALPIIPQAPILRIPMSDRIEPFQTSRRSTSTAVELLLYHDLLVPASGGNLSLHRVPLSTLPMIRLTLRLMDRNPEAPRRQPALGLHFGKLHSIVAL